MTEETEERERRTKWGRERIDIGSFQTGRGTKSFLRRTSRTNELSFRIVNLPRNEMKRWNDVLAPFSTVFTGARAPLRALAARVDVNDGTTNEIAPLPCRATSNNYFYGLSYEDYNEKYEDRLRSLIFRDNDNERHRDFILCYS